MDSSSPRTYYDLSMALRLLIEKDARGRLGTNLKRYLELGVSLERIQEANRILRESENRWRGVPRLEPSSLYKIVR